MDSEKRKKIIEINNRTDLSNSEKNKLINEVINGQKENKIVEKKCNHYKRNCLVQCVKCEKFYGCRICHDEEEDHNIDRYSIKQMKCKLCNCVQECSNKCINCNQKMAHYYCEVCHLFDNDETKLISHCEHCKICRIGDNKHCFKCNMCFDKSIFDTHKCIDENKYNDNCPVCQLDLKQSRFHTTILKCNHLMHQECLTEYLKSGNYQCPLCKKSLADMTHMWSQIESYVKLCSMPEEFQNHKVKIFCNDCEERSITKYHFTYHQCQECKGWNTEILESIIN